MTSSEEWAQSDSLGFEPEQVFARKVQEKRKASGWSQAELAANLHLMQGLDLDATAITRIERGDRRVRLNEVVAFCSVLGLDLDEVIAPHPGNLDDQIYRAQVGVRNAIVAETYWRGELKARRARLERMQQEKGQAVAAMEQLAGYIQQRAKQALESDDPEDAFDRLEIEIDGRPLSDYRTGQAVPDGQ